MRRRLGNLPRRLTIECGDCHLEWRVRRDPALMVPCPHCRAPIGAKCRRPSEHRVPSIGGLVMVHAERDLDALRAGAYGTHRQDGRCTITHVHAVARAEGRVDSLRRRRASA